MCAALEQNKTELMFKSIDPSRYGRLRHAQLFGRGQRRSFTANAQKDTDV
jgi:hypothetical protein